MFISNTCCFSAQSTLKIDTEDDTEDDTFYTKYLNAPTYIYVHSIYKAPSEQLFLKHTINRTMLVQNPPSP